MIEVLTTGTLNSIQDLGRTGYLDIGVSLCGAMDLLALQLGNALLGNEPGAASVEIAHFPFRIRFHSDIDFSIAGADCGATIDELPIPPYWTRSAKAGQTLTLNAPRRGARAYLCIAGGVDAQVVLGSRSTDQKNGFGGLEGRGLVRGDRLAAVVQPGAVRLPNADGFGAWIRDLDAIPEGRAPVCELRVVPAAQFGAFAREAQEALYAAEWLVTPDANRMGYRFSGPSLKLAEPLELLSHGIVPGTIQVPASGQPIVQLADANTCGGYPKIATVIEADLWRFAQTRVGAKIRFKEVTRAAGIEALRDQFRQISEVRAFAALLAKRS